MDIIGIKHDSPFINIRKVPRKVLKSEGDAIICLIAIIARIQRKHTEN